MMKPKSMPHVPQLDGVRSIAVGIVFFAHCHLEKVIPGGFGVTIFFFLSGFLITSLLRSEAAKTQRIDLRQFYIRRTLRIWPPLYITMAFSAAVSLIFFPHIRLDGAGIVAQALFVSNYSHIWTDGIGLTFLPLWSLAVEEHFYLIFPLLFGAAMMKLPPRSAALWCAIACVAVLLVRILAVIAIPPTDYELIYYWSHTRIDSILFGCCLALWNNPCLDDRAWRPKLSHCLLAGVVLLGCLAVRDEVFRQTIRYSLQGGALFVIFSFILQDRGIVTRVLASRPMRLVGLYSYTLYLCHITFIMLVDRYITKAIVPTILIAGTLSMLYCWAMYRLVEQPMARRRRALHKADPQVTPVTP